MATPHDLLGRARGVHCHSHRHPAHLANRLANRLVALLAALLVLTLFSTAGCGDDASSTSAPDASERDGGPGTGDAMGATDAREPPDPNAPDSGARSCGGFAGEVCDPKDYCDFPENDCGISDSTGECKLRPDLCQPAEFPVCGCDGRDYGNECEAYRAGTDIAALGAC